MQQPQQPQAQQQQQANIFERVSSYISREEDQGLALPAGYSLNNALKAAWFKLEGTKDRSGRPALQVCTNTSIGMALMDMAVQGLSPAKNQCYFIVYGNELQMQRSYFGTIAALKRLERVKDIDAQVVHEGDEFEIGADEVGRLIVKTYKPSFDNLDKPIKGAFAFIELSDGRVAYTVMTKKQIDTSWAQSRQHNVQQKFGDEMAKRTVINRAAKMIINTSDDSDLLTGAINRATEAEYDHDQDRKEVAPATEKGTPEALLAGLDNKPAGAKNGTTANTPEKPAKTLCEQLAELSTNKIPESDLPFPERPKTEAEEESVTDGQTDIYDYIDDKNEDEAIATYGDKVGGVGNAKD